MRDENDAWERSKSRKAQKPIWSPKLLSLIRTLVLRELEDYVLIPNLVSKLTFQSFEIARCLNELVMEGLLLPYNTISPYARDGKPNYVEILTPHRRYIGTWDGKQWVDKIETHVTSRKTGRIRFGSSKTEVTPVTGWDGRGYYIIRGEEFIKACKRENLTTDPIMDPWVCKSFTLDGVLCDTYNEGPDDKYHCKNCHYNRYEPVSRKSSPFLHPLDSGKPECPRCHVILKYKNMNGKKRLDHSVTKCNNAMVKFVLEQ